MFEQVKNHNPKCINETKKSAVLIPLIQVNGDIHILFEVRSKNLNRQPGEICFPGGRVDESDIDTCHTAIRETCEELLIDVNQIQIIGPLDYYMNINGMRIDAYLGELKEYAYTFNEEVESVFTVPLSYFLHHEPILFDNQMITIVNEEIPIDWLPNKKKYRFASGKTDVPFYKVDDKIIWGLTARLLYHNLKYLKEDHN